MAPRNTHIIAKHFLHLVFPEKEGHFQKQQRISKVYWEKLVQEMEKLFDRYFGPEELVRLDSLVVELGVIKWKNFEEEFVARALQALEEKLANWRNLKETEVYRLPLPQGYFQQWLEFLEKGVFDWRSPVRKESDLHKGVLDSMGMESVTVQQLQGLLRRDRQALRRLVLQHDNHFLKTVVELFTGAKQGSLVEVLQEFHLLMEKVKAARPDPPFARHFPTFNAFRLYFWTEILSSAVVAGQKKNWRELALPVLKGLVEKQHGPAFLLPFVEEAASRKNEFSKTSFLLKKLSSPAGKPAGPGHEKAQREERPDGKVEEQPIEGKSGQAPEIQEEMKPGALKTQPPEPAKEAKPARPQKEGKKMKSADGALPGEREVEDSIEKKSRLAPHEGQGGGKKEKSEEAAESATNRKEEPGILGREQDVAGEEKEKMARLGQEPPKRALKDKKPAVEETKHQRPKKGKTISEDSTEEGEPEMLKNRGQDRPDVSPEGQQVESPAPGEHSAPGPEREAPEPQGRPITEEEKARLTPPEKENQPVEKEKTEKAPFLPKKESPFSGEGKAEKTEKSAGKSDKKEEDQDEPGQFDPAFQAAVDSGGETVPEPSPSISYRAFAELPVGAAYYIQNAGTVLIHPFLPTYFRNLGLAGEQEFAGEASLHKAIHLIQYLATRETGLPEYELLLPKFLCGLPFDIPIERNIEVTEEEKEEGENLLRAAIRHWGALGDSSPDALREGFLQRDGKLEKRESGWYLMVEQRTLDILLGKLPWNLGILRLPWMKDLLKVEWA